jgi:hypothetical protein
MELKPTDNFDSELNTTELHLLENVKKDGMTLSLVPENLKTLDMCIRAVKHDSRAIEYVPKSLRFKVKKHILLHSILRRLTKKLELNSEVIRRWFWTVFVLMIAFRLLMIISIDSIEDGDSIDVYFSLIYRVNFIFGILFQWFLIWFCTVMIKKIIKNRKTLLHLRLVELLETGLISIMCIWLLIHYIRLIIAFSALDNFTE